MKKSSRVLLLTVVGLALLLQIDLSAAQSQATSKSVTKRSAILWAPAELKWTDFPDVKGAKQAILWGDPNKGAHGALVKFPAGTEVPLHTHSHEGRGVVISGTLAIALEDQPPKELGPGSYFLVPAALKHKTICKSGADHCLFLDQSPGAFDIKIVEAPASKK